MTRKPSRLFALALASEVIWFLSGAPQITDSTGWWPPVVIWTGFGFAVAGLVFAALAIRSLSVRKASQARG